MPVRLVAFAAAGLAALVAALVAFVLLRPDAPRPSDLYAEIGGPFQLVAPDGSTVSETSFPGRYLLIFFGFTYCPDVCPTELATMSAALDALGGDADRIQPLFVSVDPQRDTPEVMGQYTAVFDPRILGLTGSEAQVAAAAAAFRVYHERVEPEGGGDYLVNHSAFTYLVDPDGNTVAVLPPQSDPQAMAEAIARHLS